VEVPADRRVVLDDKPRTAMSRFKSFAHCYSVRSPYNALVQPPFWR
jgi:hypothetical protein